FNHGGPSGPPFCLRGREVGCQVAELPGCPKTSVPGFADPTFKELSVGNLATGQPGNHNTPRDCATARPRDRVYNPARLARPLSKPVRNILELVGNTPMLQLANIGGPNVADLFVKLEFLNPAFSVKDRIGVGMIERAERDGKLAKGGTIIEPT